MMKKSIRFQLTAAVIGLVLSSGILISQLVTFYYEEALRVGAIQHAEHIAFHLSMILENKVLFNDLINVQKLIDTQKSRHDSVGYIFIVKNGQVLAHTFSKGVPDDLIGVHSPNDNENLTVVKVKSTQGARYLDIAMPMLGSKAGILRLGYSETAYLKAVRELHYRIALLTLGILCGALILTHLFIKRTIGPLSKLTQAVESFGHENLACAIVPKGPYEISRLGDAFNRLIERITEYTQRLKTDARLLQEKTIELDRMQHQSKVSLEITEGIIALQDLMGVSEFLIKKMKGIIICNQIALIVLSRRENLQFLYSEGGIRTIEGSQAEAFSKVLIPLSQISFVETEVLPLSIAECKKAERVAIFPIRYGDNFLGAMIVGCPGDCSCAINELDIVHIILNICAGAIFRAVNYEEDIHDLKIQLDKTASYYDILGNDPKMRTIYQLIEDIAPSDTTILIQGESGTGKELVAQAIYKKSRRNDKPFVIINCSAYPETLLESELFGYEKGAFTGASQQKTGRFEQADGGTVFLDEIGEISSSAQVKLLRVLQSKKFERLGGNKTLSVDVRIIAATNKNLQEEVKNGHFREDLFYRLNVIPIHMPPLRNRRNDIPLLAKHFLKRFAVMHDKAEIKEFNAEAMRVLLDYHWPGNVRELENTIEHALVLSKGKQINVSHFPSVLSDSKQLPLGGNKEPSTIVENEKKLLIESLEQCNWNKSLAAQRLGISRSALYSKLKKYRITLPSN
jgi:DNA-binding NtrC family response regulator